MSLRLIKILLLNSIVAALGITKGLTIIDIEACLKPSSKAVKEARSLVYSFYISPL